jgi:hypothetical protein
MDLRVGTGVLLSTIQAGRARPVAGEEACKEVPNLRRSGACMA